MKKRIIALVLAVLMTTALCACGGGKTEEAKPENTTPEAGSTGEKLIGGEITVGIAADLDTSLDPHVSSASAGTREVLFNIFEGLVKPDSDGNILPAIAESYSANETADVYTYILREGVQFHNGDTVKVGDVLHKYDFPFTTIFRTNMDYDMGHFIYISFYSHFGNITLFCNSTCRYSSIFPY